MFYDELIKGKAPEQLALVDAQGPGPMGELEERVDHWARIPPGSGPYARGSRVGLLSRNCRGSSLPIWL